MAIKFKELRIGERFKFSPGVWSFSYECVKVGARSYEWTGEGGAVRRSKVGTVNVAVARNA